MSKVFKTDIYLKGQIKITGGDPGSGKVLTSDENGLGTWETPSTGDTVIKGTLGETITIGEIVYQSLTDGKWYLAKAEKNETNNLSVCIKGGNIDEEGEFSRYIKITGLSDLPDSKEVYLSQTQEGKITDEKYETGLIVYIGTTEGTTILNVAIGLIGYDTTDVTSSMWYELSTPDNIILPKDDKKILWEIILDRPTNLSEFENDLDLVESILDLDDTPSSFDDGKFLKSGTDGVTFETITESDIDDLGNYLENIENEFLGDLINVNDSGIQDGQTIVWDDGNDRYIPGDVGTGNGISEEEVNKLYQPNETNPFVYTDNANVLYIDGDLGEQETDNVGLRLVDAYIGINRSIDNNYAIAANGKIKLDVNGEYIIESEPTEGTFIDNTISSPASGGFIFTSNETELMRINHNENLTVENDIIAKGVFKTDGQSNEIQIGGDPFDEDVVLRTTNRFISVLHSSNLPNGWEWVSGTAGIPSWRMRLNHSGDLEIRGDFHSEGDISTDSDVNVAGEVDATGDMYAEDFIRHSDEKLKENIKPLIDKGMLDINYSSFNFIGSKDIKYGAIAQEVQKKYPDLVVEKDNGNLAIKENSLLLLEIIALKNEVKKLKQKING